MPDDLFTGTWAMNAEAHKYEFGTPPTKGLYIIEAQDEGYLITMQWTDAEGEDHEMTYTGVPDGAWYPVSTRSGMTMSMYKEGEHVLISEARMDDVQVAYAKRMIDERGQRMTIEQSGKTPDGKPFNNRSVYRRQG